MGGVPFLGVYLSVEPMIFTPVHPIMGFTFHLGLEVVMESRVNHFRRRFHGKESSPLEAIRELG